MGSNYPRWFINHHCALQEVSNGMQIYVPKTSVIFNDSINKIRKVSIGERNLDCPEKVVMLVGATGSGKSTLINYMFNYIVGVKWEDDFRLNLILDETPYGQKESQTDYITAYVIYHNSHANVPFTLTIVDTPGLGNDAEIEKDKKIIDQMRTFFNLKGQNRIDQINALGFVIQTHLSRLTTFQRYIFDSTLSLFGKDIGDNIIMLLTFADGQMSQVLAVIDHIQVPYRTYFKFNSSVLYAGKNDEYHCFDEMLWQWGTKTFKKMVVEVEKLQAKSVTLTQGILNRKNHLETAIKNLETNISIGHAAIHRLETASKYEYQAGEEDRLVEKDVNEFGATYKQILALTEDTRETMQSLERLALRTNQFVTLDYLNILIRREKIGARPGSNEIIQQLEGTKSKAVLMQQITDKTFDPFSKARKENRNGVWSKVSKYLKPRFGHGFYIDLESYRSAAHEPWMGLFSESQTSSNPTSSLKGQNRELQDRHLLELSRRLTNTLTVRLLGDTLGLQSHDVSRCLTDNSQNIGEAAYNVLQIWFQNQESRPSAWEKLCKALDKAELKMLKREILQ